jgi:hypothetical protein
MSNDAKKFGAQGGKARAKSLTSEQRKRIAAEAAAARWGTAVAKYSGMLHIDGIDLPCFVLDDNRRLLSKGGLTAALGMARGTSKRGDRLISFATTTAVNPFVDNELQEAIRNPVKFRTLAGQTADGYPATVLADICEAVLTARRDGKLWPNQLHIADRCEILVRGFARVGIVALVDEATGFQADRARDALAKILEEFVQKELRKWVRTFPARYYEQLCRLREVTYPPEGMRLPQYFGGLTNNIVYDRLAPGVKDELKRLTPKDTKGRPKNKLFQHLTEDIGVPKLAEHLAAVISLMTVSPDYSTFDGYLNKALPRWDDTLPLPLDA